MEQGRAMATNLKNRLAWGLAASVLAVGAWWHGGATGQVPAPGNGQQIVAEVNGVPITRQELADELIERFGEKQLKLFINRRIIEQACAKNGVIVTEQEVEQELRDKMRLMGSVTVSDFEKQMLRPRQLTMREYRMDVLRPTLLMRKLAGGDVQITEEELQKAFTAKYGEKVQCRIIIENNLNAAKQMHTKIAGDRMNFIRVAQTQSNPDFARTGGQLNPIARYVTHDTIERRAFEMKDDEVSEVIQTPQNGFVILLREKLLPPEKGKTLEGEREKLRLELIEEKAQREVPVLFRKLEEQAKVRDYLNDRWNINHYIQEQLQKPNP
jgi:foldase protein PrsA